MHHVSYSDLVLGVEDGRTKETKYGQIHGYLLENITSGLMRAFRTGETNEKLPAYSCPLISESDLYAQQLSDDVEPQLINVGFELGRINSWINIDNWHKPEKIIRHWNDGGSSVSSPNPPRNVSDEEESPKDGPRFNRICFPIFALALHTMLEKMRRQSHRCDFFKIFFLSGSHQILEQGGESCSTYSAALLLSLWTEQFLKDLVREAGHSVKIDIEVVHSGSGIFVYDENVRFVNQEVLPKVDEAREKCLGIYREGWSRFFHVTTTLAEGAPARVSAITQGLHHFRPDYIHILRPKAFMRHDVLFSDGVEFLNFEAASALPPVPVTSSNLMGSTVQDSDVRRLAREMLDHKHSFENAIQSNTELPEFWLRKSKRPVLSVLMVRKPDESPRFYRGMNLEVSMPTGSLCAERNVIGSAIAADPSLRRADIKIIAVLALSINTSQKLSPETTVSGLPPSPQMKPMPLENPFGGSVEFARPRVIPAFTLDSPSPPLSPPPGPITLRIKGSGQGGSNGKRSRSPNSNTDHTAGVRDSAVRRCLRMTSSEGSLPRDPKDLNPNDPCGMCSEWLKKIAEWNPSFTVMTFSSMSCQEIFLKRIV